MLSPDLEHYEDQLGGRQLHTTWHCMTRYEWSYLELSLELVRYLLMENWCLITIQMVSWNDNSKRGSKFASEMPSLDESSNVQNILDRTETKEEWHQILATRIRLNLTKTEDRTTKAIKLNRKPFISYHKPPNWQTMNASNYHLIDYG